MKKNLFFGVVLVGILLFSSTLSFAKVSDAIWGAMLEKQITVEKKDGSEIKGKLIEIQGNIVIIVKSDGRVIEIKKADAEKVSAVVLDAASDRATTSDRATRRVKSPPIEKGYFLVDMLGIAQFGPILEVGFRVGNSATLGLQVRFTGLGLVTHAVSGDNFELSSMAYGLTFQKLNPIPNSPNRFYFGGVMAVAFGATSGDYGKSTEWKGKAIHFIAGLKFGYRWRFSTKFFLNAGFMGGGAFPIKDQWWYISKPTEIKTTDDIVPAAMLELSFGWEFGGV